MIHLPHGTYMKFIRFAGGVGGDARIALYLIDGGTFLFVGYWQGYELTMAGGCWVQDGDRLRLQGAARVLMMDCPPFKTDYCPYFREYTIESESTTPKLIATDQSEAWSLLSWAPLTYVGPDQIIDAPDLTTWDEIAATAQQFVLAMGR